MAVRKLRCSWWLIVLMWILNLYVDKEGDLREEDEPSEFNRVTGILEKEIKSS